MWDEKKWGKDIISTVLGRKSEKLKTQTKTGGRLGNEIMYVTASVDRAETVLNSIENCLKF